MSLGADDIKPYIEKVKGTDNLLELRITPTDKIRSGSEVKLDADELSVLRTKTAKSMEETFKNQPCIRQIEPILAEEKCNSCHGSATGDPLAIESIRYSLAQMNSSLSSLRLTAIILSLFTIVFTYSISMFFIKKKVVTDLEVSVENIQKLSFGEMTDVTASDRSDEIGKLNNAMVKLQTSMQDRLTLSTRFADINFSEDIVLMSENDSLGKSFQTIQKSLKNLVVDLKALSNAALEGKLSYRADSSKHQGDFKEIINGVNSILEAVIGPINESSDVLEHMSGGDLTVSIKREYKGDFAKIKESINGLANRFSQTLSEVTEAIHAAASASNEISASSEQMAAGAQEQRSQTTEVVISVEEMTKTIIETTKYSARASEAATNSGIIAKEGGKVVAETIQGMVRIAEVVNKSAETVKTLGKNSDQIGEIIQVIDDIADQTNLLALNAAIEAARAGEQGRGFAVVADEVRKLAERTTKATKEIASMIKQIQRDTEGAVQSMREGTVEVEKGKKLADLAGHSLEEIIKSADEVVGKSTQVAEASEEQARAAEQIGKNIEGISNVTHESATGIQQIARTSEDLSRLTVNLQELILQFKIKGPGTYSRGDGIPVEKSGLAVRSNGVLVRRAGTDGTREER